MQTNKLVFKKIRAKNFRSIGNVMLELDYQTSPTTLISSESNGSGKSTLAIWALYFLLFGEPYSKDSKMGGLVNSRSGKDCLVELECTTLGSEWLIRRGYKPALFEMHKDGKLIDNEAANGDMQKYLQSIIGMDKKAFSNIIALGVGRFVPFMQMSAPERRAFVEQMLDLIIISSMNGVTKDKIKDIRKNIEQTNYSIGILESKLAGRKRTLDILEDKKRQRLNETGSELQALVTDSEKIVKLINMSVSKSQSIQEQIISDASQKVNSTNSMINRFKFKIDEIKRSSKNIENLEECPTCKQNVTEAHKSVIRGSTDEEVRNLTEPLLKLAGECSKHQAVVDKNNELLSEISKIREVKVQLEYKLESVNNSIKAIKSKMVDSNEDDLIAAETIAIQVLESDIHLKSEELTQLTDGEVTHLQLLQILKDDGIKASIVAQYIPFLNQNINKVLDQLNLLIQINIDSEFNISMFAPDRKGQTIADLSTGQLRRIDLAILLAWREIAKKKASVDCNVLILDEILENLSASGVEEFMDMWMAMGANVNLIAISQRSDEFSQYFDREIKYKLNDGMTVEV